MKTEGKAFKYPDNVDTDVIIPARYLNITDAVELSAHCMEDIDTSFVKDVEKGDVIVAGWNFGCGSSREHAPLVIRTCGTGCVIAKSFARIFYRNAINIGMRGGRGGDREGRPRLRGFRHGRDHRHHNRKSIPGPGLSSVHSEHHREGRPARLPSCGKGR